jgi:hypothetical protein
MNEHPGIQFEMQEGYFACSVSRSQMPAVMRYIADQKEHHYKMDSAAEFESLLKRHGFNCGINAGFVSSLKGLGMSLFRFPALPCRATGCPVPSGLCQLDSAPGNCSGSCGSWMLGSHWANW